jgi:hypothetical protein
MPRDDDSEHHNFMSLPVSDDQSAARNFVRRANASRNSVANFIQLEVVVSELYHFKLSILKSISFEELARIAEAEYSFKTGELITFCILCSDDWIPFHLDWIVGKHLANGTSIRVFSYTNGNQLLFLIISQQNRIRSK